MEDVTLLQDALHKLLTSPVTLTTSKILNIGLNFHSVFDVTYFEISFSDEAHFDLGLYINKQNCSIWCTENQHAYIEKPTYPKRKTVWCGFWSRSIIGPLFFENEQGEAVTVNANCYIAKT